MFRCYGSIAHNCDLPTLIHVQEDFSSRLENELNLLRRSMEQENSLALTELESKHAEDMRKVKDEHVSELQSKR